MPEKMTREEVSAARQRIRERVLTADLALPEGICDIRKSLDISQERFAAVTGLTKRQVAEMESGKGNPTVGTLNKLGRLFGFRVGFIPVDRPTFRPVAQDSES